MERRPYKQYSREFKLQAIRLAEAANTRSISAYSGSI